MKPLSNDLRERILDAVDNREGSRRKIAARFCVNISTITRLLQLRRQTGSFEPRPHGGGSHPPSITTPWSGSESSSGSARRHARHRCVRTWASQRQPS